MSRHTVGPWEYDPESGDIIAPKCGYQWAKGVCVVAKVESLDYGEGAGNGQLIAKAPELAKTLRWALGRIDPQNRGDYYGAAVALLDAAPTAEMQYGTAAEEVAIAQLHAAAPDLLASLVALRRAELEGIDEDDDILTLRAQADDAIAKATGAT